MSAHFIETLKADQLRVEAKLEYYLSGKAELHKAMRHAVLNGGKRLRAHLVYETARLCHVKQSAADHGAMAIELIHAYSLVHDDLPAMDDDDLRRGQPTIHVKWNEWMAILAGDALQSKAFEILSRSPLASDRSALLIQNLSQASGDEGMVLGQFLDLDAEEKLQNLSLEALENLHRNKTGALISWSAQFGAHASAQSSTPFVEYARHLGLAYQIWDDVLDVEGTSDTLGKTAGKDRDAGKATFVKLLGLDAAKKRAAFEIDAAKSAIASVIGSENLCALADFVIFRKN